MKIDLENLSPVKRRMSIEVAPEDVQRETDNVLRGYAKKARIPGFRPGKAPMSVIRSHFGREMDDDVRERVVTASFIKATQEKGLKPLGEPALEDVSHEEGKSLTFKTTFEVLPDIELKAYKNVEITQKVVSVAEEEVEKGLDEIRRSRVQLVAEEGRAAAEGDVVYVDIEGAPEDGEGFDRERLPIEVGAENNLEEFNEKLLGAEVGNVLEFPVQYPAEYGAKHLAGKQVNYRLVVREVKRPVLPDLDDEFAKDLGEFDNLDALRDKVRGELEARKQHEARMAARQALLNRVLTENPVVLPDVLVEQELRRQLEDVVRNMILQGVDPKKAEIDWEGLRKQREEPARKSVHARLILDAIAEAEQIQVNDKDVEARIREDAERLGESPEKLRARMSKHAGQEALKTQLVREKSLDYLTSVANIQYAD